MHLFKQSPREGLFKASQVEPNQDFSTYQTVKCLRMISNTKIYRKKVSLLALLQAMHT